MNLKNYTSSTPARTSIERIERCLVRMKARNVIFRYGDDQELKAISFVNESYNGSVAFELPSRLDAVFKTLWDQVRRPQPDTKKRLQQQAERTAWKIIADWVEIQEAMVTLDQIEFIQAFMPYALMPEGGTFYQSNHFVQK